jgi:adenylate cyclase
MIYYSPLHTMIQKKILVIDDEQDIRDSIKRILTAAGYFVLTTGNLRNAVKMLAEDATFDLITCDIMIPEMGGFELIDEIKADPEYTHIPVLMVTGMDVGILKMTTHLADDVLPKPFTSEQLLLKVKTLLEGTFTKSQRPSVDA